jgi:GNAT superfamily N-acetyltransferase
MPFRLASADSGPRLDGVRTLFREYQDFLGFPLCFQDFEAELAGLPGRYAPPEGRILVAEDEGGRVAGVIALRKIGEAVCEMKRLYVRPEFRGRGLGRLLADAIVREAVAIGYRTMKLDTVPKLKEAIALYRSMGFRETAGYCHNPIEGALFFEKDLET